MIIPGSVNTSLTTKVLFVLVLNFLPPAVLLQAQQTVLDSLKQELENHPDDDTVRFKILKELCANTDADPATSKYYADQALELAVAIQYEWGIASAHYSLADYFLNRMDFRQAVDHGLQALRGYENLDNAEALIGTYEMLAGIYVQMKDYERAETYMNKTLALAEAHKDLVNYGVLYANLGILYISEKKFLKGIDYLTKALTIYKDKNDINSQAIVYYFIAQSHADLKEFERAIANYTRSINAATASGDASSLYIIAPAHEGIASVYIQMKVFDKARAHLDTALPGAQQIDSKNTLIKIYQDLVLVHEASGDYPNALKYEKMKNVLRDSVFNSDRSQQLAEVETRYETEKKEQTIRLLEKDNKINELSRNLLGAGLASALLMGGFIFYLQRLRSKRNRELLERKEALNQKLVELDHVKSRFFASISHEFRTPLSLILAPLEEQLRDQHFSEKEKQSLLLMKRNASRLLDLVNQLLDLSKLETGKMQLRVKYGDIDVFLKIVSASFDSLAQHSQIHFQKNIPVSQAVYYDEDKLEKIITNLLSNAFKFTAPGGTVTLDVVVNGDHNNGTLSFKIADTGMGIPHAEQEHIFSPFYQVTQPKGFHRQGTGLGLSLVRELVKLYGGDIKLDSRESVGTTFTVLLPAGKEQFLSHQTDEGTEHDGTSLFEPVNINTAEYIDHQNSATGEKDLILIVEDHSDLRNFMSSVLQDEFNVYTASDGEEGLKIALEVIPDLVLTDLMMPAMDGIQLAEVIKNDERTSHIPIILLTAKNEPQSRLEGLKTGADDYLTKPFSTEELKIRIANLIRVRKKLAEKYSERIVIFPDTNEERSLDEKFLSKAFQLVENQLSDFSLTVEKLADDIGLSRKQLFRKIKALTGLSPIEFIRDIRLKKAADMIRQKSDTVSQIGYASGFSDPSYFAKCFKKKFGMTPSEFSEKGHADPAA